ncbi:MAG: AMP-binding protein [Deltaproteobacteria bacterium]|nr:AMP-binding protein [Deltaproteobacteria bacterium]
MDLLFPPLGAGRPATGAPLLSLGEARLDAAALGAAVHAAARLLEAEGLTEGEPVLIEVGGDAENLLAVLPALLAVMELGAVAVPHAGKLGHRALAHLRADTAARLRVGRAAAEGSPLTGLCTLEPARLREAASEGSRRGGALRRALDDRPCLMLYTSGTTGSPKGVPHSPAGLAANLDALARAWAWGEATPVVHALPLFHVHGLVLGLFGGLRHGGGLLHLPRFEPGALARAVGERRGMLFSVPTMLHRLVEAGREDPGIGEALGRARRLISGSAPLPRRMHAAVEALCGQPVFERYGLTESAINCAVRVEDGPDPGFVGPPLPGVELKLVADDGLSEVPSDGESLGEVWVRGPSVMRGYHGQEAASAKVLLAGWLKTGDIAARRADGSVRLVGRRSVDLIKSGGYRIGAGEVEAALLELPGVAEVAVVGVADDDLGQRIEAFVVPAPGARPDPAALIQGVAEALSPHQRPRAVHLRDELPRNAMGKVQKKLLLD